MNKLPEKRKRIDKRAEPTKWQIRRAKRIMRIYQEKFGSNNAAMARELGFKWPDYVRFICRPDGPGGRWIGEDTAEKIEEKLGLPEHWLDYPEHVSDTTIRLHGLIDKLSPQNQEILIAMVKTLVEQQDPPSLKELPKPQGNNH